MSVTWEDIGITSRPGKNRWAQPCVWCDSDRKKKGTHSLTVNDEVGNRWYKCWNCGKSGNLDIEEQFQKVKEQSKMPSQEKEFTMKTREYIASRGISLNTAKSRRLYETYGKSGSILCFPVFLHLTLVNVKFLRLDYKKGDKGPKWWQLSKEIGTKIMPFGTQTIKWPEEGKKVLIITEGEWDALTWVECGYNNTISVPQGAPSPNAKDFKEEFAWAHDPYFKSLIKDVDQFILSTDDDEAGRLLRYHLSLILGKDKCRIIRYPVGYKDINEVLIGDKEKDLPGLGKEGVNECYINIASVPIKGIIRPSHVGDELNILRNEGFTPGLKCGVPEVDRLYTVKPKHIEFITGVPGSGKSVYIRWYIQELIKNNKEMNMKWALFTPENRPVSREYAKIAECLTGQFVKKGYRNSMSDELYRDTMRFIEKHFIIISPDRMNYERWDQKTDGNNAKTLEGILKYLEYLKKTENIFGYVIDAWNKIEHEQPKYMTETSFISQQLDHLIDFQDYWDLHGIIIVHPKKIENVGNNYKMPSLYDIKGSSAWKEKADIGIIAHRYKMKKLSAEEMAQKGIRPDTTDEDLKWEKVNDAPTIIKTEKIRFEELGVEDRVRLKMVTGGRFEVDKSDNKYSDPVDSPQMAIGYDTDKDDDLPF